MDRRLTPGRTYGLSFRPPSREEGTPLPELVITVSAEIASSIEARLQAAHERDGDRAANYLLEDADTAWYCDEVCLPGFPRCIGYGSCGYIVESGTEVEYRFPFVASKRHFLSYTLWRCLETLLILGYDLEDAAGPAVANQQQLMGLHTRCEHSANGWGHMIGGYAYPAFRRWLTRLAEAKEEDPLAPAREAMRLAYAALVPEHAHFSDMCDARLHSSGRFILECPGNACDVALYPEEDRYAEYDEPSPIGCHNLDGAHQQLTLLCGLAVLHQLAERDIG